MRLVTSTGAVDRYRYDIGQTHAPNLVWNMYGIGVEGGFIERHRSDSEESLIGDEVLLTAVIHWVQTIGKAANAVSEQTRRRIPRFLGARSWT
jgi:hypothetical protein